MQQEPSENKIEQNEIQADNSSIAVAPSTAIIKTRHRVIFFFVMLLFLVAIMVVYVALHELGHVIGVVAFGGTVTEAIFFGLDARVYFYGVYSRFSLGTIAALGTIFPIALWAIVFIFYKSNIAIKNTVVRHAYHLLTMFFTVNFVMPLFVWIFLFLPASQDPTIFIIWTEVNPSIVAFISLAVMILTCFFVYKKRLPHAIIKTYKESWFGKNINFVKIDKKPTTLKRKRIKRAVAILTLYLVVFGILLGIFASIYFNPNF